MYNASSILSKARTYYVPRGFKNKKTKIFVFGNKKTRYYYGDREFYRNDYLKSNHWKELRSNKLAINPICEQCGSSNMVEPHHLQYKNLYDVTIDDLKSLCRKCHQKIHKIKYKKRKHYSNKRIDLKLRNKTIREVSKKLNLKKDMIDKYLKYAKEKNACL